MLRSPDSAAASAASSSLLPIRICVAVAPAATILPGRPTLPQEAEAALAAVRRATRLWPGRSACLEESLAAYFAAALTGHRVRWVIEARFLPQGAHAWIEAGTRGGRGAPGVAGACREARLPRALCPGGSEEGSPGEADHDLARDPGEDRAARTGTPHPPGQIGDPPGRGEEDTPREPTVVGCSSRDRQQMTRCASTGICCSTWGGRWPTMTQLSSLRSMRSAPA